MMEERSRNVREQIVRWIDRWIVSNIDGEIARDVDVWKVSNIGRWIAVQADTWIPVLEGPF